MAPRFQARLAELLDDAEGPLALLCGALPRLGEFLEPFVRRSIAPQRANAKDYVEGLLSDLASKDAESIAYLHDRERQGQGLQTFIGQADRDHRPLIGELARQVGQNPGRSDAVLVFDPSAFPKCGTKSVGVARQWCGRLGKVDNCQVGVFLGYVSSTGHAPVDFRLYLGREWTIDRKRMNEARVPGGVRFATRHELAPAMLDEHGGALPHARVAGDDEMGRSSHFRQELRPRGERYLLAVPSNPLVHDLKPPDPPYGGHGRHPRPPFVRADRWCSALPGSAWQSVEVRDGEKSPLVGRPRAPERRDVQARLPAVQRHPQRPGARVRARAQGGAPGGGESETGQEGGGPGRLPGQDVVGLAPPHGAGAGGDLVPE